MSNFLVMRFGEKLVTLDEDLKFFRAIAKFATKREDLQAKLKSVVSPRALLTMIEGMEEGDELSQVLGQLGLSNEAKRVKDLIAKMREKYGNEIDALETLLTPVGSFYPNIATANGLREADRNDAEIDWDVFSVGGNLPIAKKNAFGLDFSGDLDVSINAAAKWPFSEDMPQPLLGISVVADGALNGKGAVAFSPAFIEANAGVQAGVDLDLYYHVSQPQSVVAAEVLSRLSKTPNFFDFDDLWDAFADPSIGLEGIRLRYNSELEFDLKVGVGKKFSFAKGVDVEAGFSVNVGVRRPSELELTFMAGEDAVGGGRTIIAKLSRDETKERLAGLSAGLVLDLTKLAPRVHALLKEALGEWTKGLDKIKPFLSPGTLIKEELDGRLDGFVADLVGDTSLSKALTKDLRLLLGSKADDDLEVAGWLVEQLGAELDKVGAGKLLDADNFESFVGDAAKSATQKIASRLPRVGGTSLTDKLEAKIVDLARTEAAKLHKSFKDEVTNAFNSNNKDLASELRRLGDKGSKTLASLDDALGRVRELVDRYDGLFKQIVKATEDSAWAKISASIFLEEARTDQTSMQLAGTFLAKDSNARDVFDALLHGKVQSAATVLSDDNSSFDLDEDQSSITRFTKSSSKFGYELVLFGFSMKGSKLITGQAEVSVGGDGSITLDSKGSAVVEKSGRGESRSATFTTASSILLARASTDQPAAYDRNIDLGFSFSHKDRRLARNELTGIIDSLVDVDLLRKEDRGRAVTVFNQWGGKGSNAEIRATVDIKLGLGREGMLTLLGLDEHSVEPSLSSHERARIAAAYRAMRAKYDKAGDKEKHIKNYQAMITEMRRIYLSRPAGLAAVESEQGWSEEAYEEAEKKIAKLALKRIKHLNKNIFKSDGFGSRLDKEFLIFIAVLKHLSTHAGNDEALAAEDNWATNVIITHRHKKKEHEVFVLT